MAFNHILLCTQICKEAAQKLPKFTTYDLTMVHALETWCPLTTESFEPSLSKKKICVHQNSCTEQIKDETTSDDHYHNHWLCVGMNLYS